MHCTEKRVSTAIPLMADNLSGKSACAISSRLTQPPVELDMIPFGTNQWVPMPRQATLGAPKALHFAQYLYETRRWQYIVDKAILADLTPVFLARAAQYASIHGVYQWSSGDNVFLGDYEIAPGKIVRLKVEVL